MRTPRRQCGISRPPPADDHILTKALDHRRAAVAREPECKRQVRLRRNDGNAAPCLADEEDGVPGDLRLAVGKRPRHLRLALLREGNGERTAVPDEQNRAKPLVKDRVRVGHLRLFLRGEDVARTVDRVCAVEARKPLRAKHDLARLRALATGQFKRRRTVGRNRGLALVGPLERDFLRAEHDRRLDGCQAVLLPGLADHHLNRALHDLLRVNKVAVVLACSGRRRHAFNGFIEPMHHFRLRRRVIRSGRRIV